MKLRMLNSKVKADFLVAMKKNIEMQMNMQPMVMTCTYGLSNYYNTFNQRHPNNNNTNKTCRIIQALAGCEGKKIGRRRDIERG